MTAILRVMISGFIPAHRLANTENGKDKWPLDISGSQYMIIWIHS